MSCLDKGVVGRSWSRCLKSYTAVAVESFVIQLAAGTPVTNASQFCSDTRFKPSDVVFASPYIITWTIESTCLSINTNRKAICRRALDSWSSRCCHSIVPHTNIWCCHSMQQIFVTAVCNGFQVGVAGNNAQLEHGDYVYARNSWTPRICSNELRWLVGDHRMECIRNAVCFQAWRAYCTARSVILH